MTKKTNTEYLEYKIDSIQVEIRSLSDAIEIHDRQIKAYQNGKNAALNRIRELKITLNNLQKELETTKDE